MTDGRTDRQTDILSHGRNGRVYVVGICISYYVSKQSFWVSRLTSVVNVTV